MVILQKTTLIIIKLIKTESSSRLTYHGLAVVVPSMRSYIQLLINLFVSPRVDG